MTDEREGIDRLREAFLSSLNSGDLDAWMATFTDDAVIMAPDQPAVRGSAEVRS